jgi:hypothetical protein
MWALLLQLPIPAHIKGQRLVAALPVCLACSIGLLTICTLSTKTKIRRCYCSEGTQFQAVLL